MKRSLVPKLSPGLTDVLHKNPKISTSILTRHRTLLTSPRHLKNFNSKEAT